ncbi:type V toxin-antitoxin system endoribonuclease antitoxin GhoS [Erwinia persicina]|uniref:type V toxin-antitoxin system endoribonuclease antitoxin GhoS n=1 Tax=Erwinia persicina TaxID=55211 RepID=UPI00178292FF|nr:type V toxin-antitoxin system endoribonuclease antitoxin GhoS [Erwinia persicina]MBD8161809.1 type V toxin-antitoxin system endoribonuclease antitoxin GhoS [Erwinia persicina]MBD8212748.1 type V toxin-antitoxin system endoribonuclease antitoxin GhoS [Erwinia persicina]
MSNHGIGQYVVTFHYNEKGLSDLLELSSALVNGGFSTTLKDDNGQPHELGTNSFGMITTLSEEEIRQQAAGIGELILGEAPEVEVQSWESFRKNSG